MQIQYAQVLAETPPELAMLPCAKCALATAELDEALLPVPKELKINEMQNQTR
jgi:hypothetical protein